MGEDSRHKARLLCSVLSAGMKVMIRQTNVSHNAREFWLIDLLELVHETLSLINI